MGDVSYFPHQQPVPDGYLTGPDLCKATGISYRQLDYWTRTGRLHTQDVPAPGSGYRRLYPDTEIPVARHMAALLDAGLTLAAAHDAARQLARGHPTRLGPYQLTNPTPEDQQP